jgi:ABC-2 type transport system permease protein
LVKRKKYLYLSLLIPFMIALLFLIMLSPSNSQISLGVCNLDPYTSSETIFSEIKGFNPILFESENCTENLKEQISLGEIPLGIVIPADFSANIKNLEQARIDVYLDKTDIAFSNMVEWKLDTALTPFKKNIIESINSELKAKVSSARTGIRFIENLQIKSLQSDIENIDRDLEKIENMETEFVLEPVWTNKQGINSENDSKRTSIVFILPIILLFTILMLSSTSLIYDKRNNFISRVKTSTSVSLYLFAKIVFFFCLAIVQAFVIFLLYLAYGNAYLVNFWNVIHLLLFISFINCLLGVLIGIVSENEGIAILFSLIISFPLMLLSGIFYPIQTLSPVLQGITKVLPLSPQIEFAKRVLIFNSGFGFQWLWIAFGLFLICFFLIRRKN